MEHLNTNTIHNTRHFACIVLYGTQPNSDFFRLFQDVSRFFEWEDFERAVYDFREEFEL